MLGLMAPAAFARPHPKAARSAVKPAAPAVRSAAKGHHPAPTRLEPVSAKSHRVAGPALTWPKSRGHQAPRQTPHAAEAREALAAPDPPHVEAPLPEIHVTHDRKVHLKPGAVPYPGAAEQSPEPATPQKANNADFLQSVPAPVAVMLPRPGEEPQPPALKKARLPKQIFPVVSVAPDPVPVLMPALYTRRGRLIMPPAMKGSHEILLHQNEMADREGLVRVQDDEDLERLRGSKMLVAIPASSGLEIDERLPANRRFCRPWTAQFLAAVGRAHYARFHAPLQVNSAVRTVEVQQRLLQTNGNAAPAEGSTASPHLTGQAVDIAKHGLSMGEIAWLRGYLLPLVQQGKVDVEEEFQQSCFHISVYRQYAPQAPPRRIIPRHHSAAEVLAVALP